MTANHDRGGEVPAPPVSSAGPAPDQALNPALDAASDPVPSRPPGTALAPPPEQSREPRHDRIARGVTAAALSLLVAGLLGNAVRVPYVIEYPGAITDTLGDTGTGTDTDAKNSGDQRQPVTVEGARTYPTEGSLYFTTVSILGGPQRHVTFWEWARGHLDDTASVVPERQIFGEETSDEEVKKASVEDMQGSQKTAEAVGIRSTGRKVGQRNLVAQIGQGLPADGPLRLRDEILQVDGRQVDRIPEVVAAISDRKPGEEVRLGIRRDGSARTVTLRTRDLGGGRAGIGVGLEPVFDYPFAVTIDAGEVGGPSAGMMFALAVHDVLTPGALTGGEEIAGTGTIDDAGEVGPIGGIAQKMIGAKAGGARYFLAPAANCEQVVGHVPEGLAVVRVSDIDEALTAVRTIARTKDVAGLPTCT